MEDAQIVSLYWERSEDAIRETERKYGAFCHALALNILSIREDAEECVNDTWHHAWNAMPEERPSRLQAWLGKVVRNLAIDRWRLNRAKRRYAGMELLLSELEDCVPAAETVEDMAAASELGRIISRWLETLPEDVFPGKTIHGIAADPEKREVWLCSDDGMMRFRCEP